VDVVPLADLGEARRDAREAQAELLGHLLGVDLQFEDQLGDCGWMGAAGKMLLTDLEDVVGALDGGEQDGHVGASDLGRGGHVGRLGRVGAVPDLE
jgi:hypothetical protein